MGEWKGYWPGQGNGYVDNYYSSRQYVETTDLGQQLVVNWHKFAMPIVLGDNVTFEAKQTDAGFVRATITDLNDSDVNYHDWSHAPAPFANWQVGEEWTCSTGSIKGTYVFNNEYRRNSDHNWVYVESGTPLYTDEDGGFNWYSWDNDGHWCTTFHDFIYWYNWPEPDCG